jgi:hypothetical protein
MNNVAEARELGRKAGKRLAQILKEKQAKKQPKEKVPKAP